MPTASPAPRSSTLDGRKDHQDVHEGKHGVEATGEVDQQADQGEVEGALDEALKGQPPLAAERHGVRQGQTEGHAQDPVEGGGVEGESLPQVQDDGGPQERRRQEEPRADQPLELGEQACGAGRAIPFVQSDQRCPLRKGKRGPRPAAPDRCQVPTGYFPTTVTSLKMGRYMAMTTPPITTPRKTMSIGSRSAVRLVTAVSTSSS